MSCDGFFVGGGDGGDLIMVFTRERFVVEGDFKTRNRKRGKFGDVTMKKIPAVKGVKWLLLLLKRGRSVDDNVCRSNNEEESNNDEKEKNLHFVFFFW